jgi:hypothetical protein
MHAHASSSLTRSVAQIKGPLTGSLSHCGPTQPRGRGLRRAVPFPESDGGAAWRCRTTCGVVRRVSLRLCRWVPACGPAALALHRWSLQAHTSLAIHTHITRCVCPPSPVAVGTWLPNDRLPWLIPSSRWSEAWEFVWQKSVVKSVWSDKLALV